MATTHSHPLRGRERRRRLDLASLALLLCGLAFGVLAYFSITERGANPLLIVPAVVAATLGANHLVKYEAPRS